MPKGWDAHWQVVLDDRKSGIISLGTVKVFGRHVELVKGIRWEGGKGLVFPIKVLRVLFDLRYLDRSHSIQV